MPRTAPIPVIYVVSMGRSGSTLLGQLLGGHDRLFYAGEVYNWKNNHEKTLAGDTRYCSCGTTLQDCPHWERVRERLDGEFGTPYVDLKDQDPATFAAHNGALFRAALQESGREVIVDASKRVYRLNLMLKSPEVFDVTIVHLVRDARAFGYSILKTLDKRGWRPRAYYRKTWMWLRKNLALRLLYGRRAKYVVVPYEELVTDPMPALGRILGHVGLAPDPAMLDRAAHTHHDFSGNIRARLRDVKPLALDAAYLDQLSAHHWNSATAMAAPGLLAFGYPLSRAASRAAYADA